MIRTTFPPGEDDWCRDPAASGWRDRGFFDHGEVLVYDDGGWEVRLYKNVPHTTAAGREGSKAADRARALAVYAVLTVPVPS
jgi:hypothetical protein